MENNLRHCVQDMAKALKSVFGKYSLNCRREAWKMVTSGNGKKDMEVILLHPDKPTSKLKRVSFTEWMKNRTMPR